jgi:cysteine dioxygenase
MISLPSELKSRGSRRGVGQRLSRIFVELDRHRQRIPLAELSGILKRIVLSREDVEPFVRFGRDCYRRNLVHTGPAYQALVLCWRSGQRSPIHDHRGSACALRIIEGVATETRFEFSPCGLLYATKTRAAKTGTVCASFDMDIHQMGNLEPAGQDLITLHIYSPPLLHMGTYFLGNSVIGEDENAAAALMRQRSRGRSRVGNDDGGQMPHWRGDRTTMRVTQSPKRSRSNGLRSAANG